MELHGLTSLEVKSLIDKGLVNKSKVETSKKLSHILRDNLVSLFNILITPILCLLVYLKLYKEFMSVGVVAFINIIIGIFQEVKAKRALDKISLIDIKTCIVIRDGVDKEIEIEEIVQGDFIRIKSGEPFLADGKIAYSHHLEVDESMLTGESDYIPKPLDCEVLSGSFCVSGEGVYIAEKISDESYVNNMAKEAKKYKKFLSPIQKKVDYLVKFLIFFGLSFSLLMLVKYLILLKINPAAADPRSTVKSISAIVQTLIPQGLVLTVTLVFIFGILRMSKKGVLIQKPNAIESMAHVNVMCMDKTGTLTLNRLSLNKIISDSLDNSELEKMLKYFAYGSLEKNKTIEAITNSIGEEKAEVLDVIPFTSKNKYSGVRIKSDGEVIDLIMGAYESIKPMIKSSSNNKNVEQIIDENTKLGLRVIIFIYKKSSNDVSLKEELTDFNIAGTLLFEDEIKPEAQEILDYFQEKEIELKIISGDHPDTVSSIAMKLDIKNADKAITGKELNKLDEKDFEKAVLENTIFARVSPQNKLDIVKTLQRNKYYVSMVGDGVNDALAIKEAYLGVCMGSGARVTKDVSDMILINDSFEVMPKVLTQGRNIIQNVKDIAKIFLFKNTYAILLIILTQFLNIAFPFVPQQVTLLNFVTITLPTAYIVVFTRKGTDMKQGYLREISVYALTGGLVAASIAMLMGLYSVTFLGNTNLLTRTFIISTIVIMAMFNYIFVFTSPQKIKELFDKRAILTAMAFMTIFPLAMYLFPKVRNFFVLARLNVFHWSAIIGGTVVGIILMYIVCRFNLVYKIFAPSEDMKIK